MKKCMAGAVAMLLCVSSAFAGEHKGKVASVDADKNTITITVKGEEKTFTLADNCEFTAKNKKAATRLSKQKLNFKGFSRKPTVTLTTEGEGKDEKVTKVTLGGGKKKPKTDK